MEIGYEQTTMKAVAERAGTSIAQLYLSFPSKQMLLIAVYDRGNSVLVKDYMEPAYAAPGDDRERVANALVAFASFFVKEPKLSRLMMFTSFEDLDTSDPEVQRHLSYHVQALGEVFKMLGPVADGSDTAPVDVLRWGWCGVWGIAVQRYRMPHLAVPNDDEYARVIDAGVQLLLDGLAYQRERRAAAGG